MNVNFDEYFFNWTLAFKFRAFTKVWKNERTILLWQAINDLKQEMTGGMTFMKQAIRDEIKIMKEVSIN